MRLVAIAISALVLSAPVVSAQAPERPPHRVGSSVAWDAARGRLVLFGGVAPDGSASAGDTWEWDGERWHRLAATPAPAARLYGGMVYDAARGLVVLYGGVSEQGALGDMWTWDGERWTEVVAEGPGPRALHGLAYDPGAERVLLVGGIADDDGEPIDDVWGWDGAEWTRLQAPSAFGGVTAAEGLRLRAYRAAMRSDLRNLVTAQEMYFSDNSTYASSMEVLGSLFAPSPGVTVRIVSASADGWAAIATHEGVPDARCGSYVGDAEAPFPEVTQEGAPACAGFPG